MMTLTRQKKHGSEVDEVMVLAKSRSRLTVLWSLLLLLCFVTCADLQAQTIYVKADAQGRNDGSSWVDAYSGEIGLENALDRARPGTEIWVAQGIYKPFDKLGFVMKDDVQLYGGFYGDEHALDLRDWSRYETHLSGEIGEGIAEDDASPVVNGGEFAVTSASNVVVDGFTIRDGNGAAKDWVTYGGGASWVALKNCILENNSAHFGAGAVGGLLVDCIIRNNYAKKFGGGAFGANLVDCLVQGNRADEKGGGVAGDRAETPFGEGVSHCRFQFNEANEASAIYNISKVTDTRIEDHHEGRSVIVDSSLFGCTVQHNAITISVTESEVSGGTQDPEGLQEMQKMDGPGPSDGPKGGEGDGGGGGPPPKGEMPMSDGLSLLIDLEGTGELRDCVIQNNLGAVAAANISDSLFLNNSEFSLSSDMVNVVALNNQTVAGNGVSSLTVGGWVRNGTFMYNRVLHPDSIAHHQTSLVNVISQLNSTPKGIQGYGGSTGPNASGNQGLELKFENSSLENAPLGRGNFSDLPKWSKGQNLKLSSDLFFDETSGQSAFFFDQVHWQDDEKAHEYLRLGKQGSSNMYLIVSNSANALLLQGRVDDHIKKGDSVQLISLRPLFNSRTVDAGQGQLGRDISKGQRYDHPLVANSGEGGVQYVDIGAYESRLDVISAGNHVYSSKGEQHFRGRVTLGGDWRLLSSRWTSPSANIQLFQDQPDRLRVNTQVEGIYTLEYRAALESPSLGRTEVSDRVLFYHDRTPPKIMLPKEIHLSGPGLIKADIKDKGSPMESTRWSVSSGPAPLKLLKLKGSAPGEVQFASSANQMEGIYVLKVLARDRAGNESSQDLTVVYDRSAPSIRFHSIEEWNGVKRIKSTITDQSLPLRGLTWSQVLGPGDLSFGDVHGTETLIWASEAGSYVVNLSVSDALGQRQSENIILVWEAGTTATSATADFYLRAPSSISATPTPTLPSIEVSSWNLNHGAGNVNLGVPSGAHVDVSMDREGVYDFSVTVSDNLGRSEQQTVQVLWDVTPPMLQLGSNVMVDETIELRALVFEPLSGIKSVKWEKISGPNPIVFSNADQLKTTFRTFQDGVYRLQCTVEDLSGHQTSEQMDVHWDSWAFLPTPKFKPKFKEIGQVFSYGEAISLNGRITPVPDSPIHIDAINPRGESSPGRTFFPSSEGFLGGGYSPDQAGDWILTMRTEDSSNYKAASTLPFFFTVLKAESTVILNAPSQVELGKEITIAGALKAFGAPESEVLEGLPLELTVTSPAGVQTSYLIVTENFVGSFVHHLKLDQAGAWSVSVHYAGDENLAGSSSEAQRIEVVERPGYAVVVTGEIDGQDGYFQHTKTTNDVVSKLKSLSFKDEDIFYFNRSISEAPAANFSGGNYGKQQLDQLIRGELLSKMELSPAPLYMVFVNHGSPGVFHMGPLPEDEISPQEIHDWLALLESGLSEEQVQKVPRITVVGSCHSGSFLPELAGAGRINISSAANGELSHRGPKLSSDGSDRHGEYFVTLLFKLFAEGNSISQAFELAIDQIHDFTQSQAINALFADHSAQHPLLDDDGDGFGEAFQLSKFEGDGVLSSRTYCGVRSNSLLVDVTITEVSPSLFIELDDDFPEFTATINDSRELENVLVEFKKPGFTQINDLSASMQAPVASEQVVTTEVISLSADDNRAMATFNDKAYAQLKDIDLRATGHFTMHFFARDADSQNLSDMITRHVYRRLRDRSSSIQSFELLAPENGAVESSAVAFQWEGNADGSRQFLLRIWSDAEKKELYHESPLLGVPQYVLEAGVLEDASDYHWDVVTIDESGDWKNSLSTYSFSVDAKNALPAWVSGVIQNKSGGALLTDAVVEVGEGSVYQSFNGAFLMQLTVGEHVLNFKAEGFEPLETSIRLEQGSNRSFVVDLVSVDGSEPQVPRLELSGPSALGVGEEVTLSALTLDGGQVPQYRWTSSNPQLLSLIPNGAQLTVKALAAGDVVISVSDDANGLLEQMTLTVLAQGQGGSVDPVAPVFLSSPPLIVGAGNVYTYEVESEPRNAEILLVHGPDGMSLSEGRITWTPQALQMGSHRVIVSARNEGLTAEQSFVL
jgi:hypothetical protein